MAETQQAQWPRIGLTVGERIKLARQSRSMSALELTRHLPCDERELRRIEAGERKPRPGMLEQIAWALGVPIRVLVLPTPIMPETGEIHPHVGLEDDD